MITDVSVTIVALILALSGIISFWYKKRRSRAYQHSGEPIRSLMPGCLLLIIFPALAAVTGFMIYQILT